MEGKHYGREDESRSNWKEGRLTEMIRRKGGWLKKGFVRRDVKRNGLKKG